MCLCKGSRYHYFNIYTYGLSTVSLVFNLLRLLFEEWLRVERHQHPAAAVRVCYISLCWLSNCLCLEQMRGGGASTSVLGADSLRTNPVYSLLASRQRVHMIWINSTYGPLLKRNVMTNACGKRILAPYTAPLRTPLRTASSDLYAGSYKISIIDNLQT